MANRADIPLGGNNAIELLEKRVADMAARAAAKGIVPTARSPPATSRRLKKRVGEDTSPAWSGDDIVLRFPSTASSYSEFGPHYDEAKKLLWPEDVARFKERGRVSSGRSGVHHLFQGMLTMMHLTDEVGDMEAQLASSTSDRGKLCKENMALQSQKEEVSLKVVELQSELKAARSEIESLRIDLADAEDRVSIAALRAEIKVKAKMIEELENGLSHTWDRKAAFEARGKLEQLGLGDPIGDVRGSPMFDVSQLIGDDSQYPIDTMFPLHSSYSDLLALDCIA